MTGLAEDDVPISRQPLILCRFTRGREDHVQDSGSAVRNQAIVHIDSRVRSETKHSVTEVFLIAEGSLFADTSLWKSPSGWEKVRWRAWEAIACPEGIRCAASPRGAEGSRNLRHRHQNRCGEEEDIQFAVKLHHPALMCLVVQTPPFKVQKVVNLQDVNGESINDKVTVGDRLVYVDGHAIDKVSSPHLLPACRTLMDGSCRRSISISLKSSSSASEIRQ